MLNTATYLMLVAVRYTNKWVLATESAIERLLTPLSSNEKENMRKQLLDQQRRMRRKTSLRD